MKSINNRKKLTAVIIIFLLAIVVSSIVSMLQKTSNRIYNIEYAQTSERPVISEDYTMTETDSFRDISSIFPNIGYIISFTANSDEDNRELKLYTQALYTNIYIDGAPYSPLSGDALSPHCIIIPLNESGEHNITILSYAPFGFFIEASLTAPGAYNSFDIISFVIPSASLLSMAVLFILYQKNKLRTAGFILPLICIITIFASNPLGDTGLTSSIPELRLCYAAMALLPCTAWLISKEKTNLPCDSPSDVILTLHIMHALIIFFMPYQSAFNFFIKILVPLSIIEILLYVIFYIKKYIKPEPYKAASSLIILTAGVLCFTASSVRISLITNIAYPLLILFFTVFDSILYLFSSDMISKEEELYIQPSLITLPQFNTKRAVPPISEKIKAAADSAAGTRKISNYRYFIDKKCNISHNHCYHVADYTYHLCRFMDYTEEEAVKISEAAFWHDIGKLVIDERILKKRGKLAANEFEQIKRHTFYGKQILAGDDEFSKLCENIAYQHHERYDGNGYNGMTGDTSDPHAAIVSVADVMDALTSSREYKRKWSFEEAFNYIISHSGDFFDPSVVKALANNKKYIRQLYELLDR